MTVAAADYRLAVYEAAAARLGRPLTRGELAIDIVQADRDLAEGKARLARAIEAEKRRAVRAIIGLGLVGRVEVTAPMVVALRWLYGRGRDHALAEMERLGVEPERRRFYARELRVPSRLLFTVDKLTGLLGGVNVRVQTATSSTLAEYPDAIGDSVLASTVARQVPGALDAASRIVSSGFTAGVADVYEAHADLFTGWQYTAVMDDGTCEECESHDGEEYETLEEMYAVLPDFGPNPECLGGDRCRCRGVPLAAET